MPAAKLRARKRCVRSEGQTERAQNGYERRERERERVGDARAHDRLVDGVVGRGLPRLERKLDHLLLVLLGVPARLGRQKRELVERLDAEAVLEGVLDRSGCRVPVGHDAVLDEVADGGVRAVEVDAVAVDVGGRLRRVGRGEGGIGGREHALGGVLARVAVADGVSVTAG